MPDFRRFSFAAALPLAIIFLLVSLPALAAKASSVNSEDYENGAELYDLACANCHGKNMVNPGTSSFNLRAFPRDEKQRFIDSVTKGKGFMPALGDIFDSEEIQQLWIYVSTPQ